MVQSKSSEHPEGFAHALAAGATCGLLAIVQSIGVGSLIAAGAPFFSSVAIGMALLATAIVGAITANQSSIAGIVGVAQSLVAVALVGTLSVVLRHVAPGDEASATLVAVLVLATLAVGAASLFLGVFRLGRFIRFVPFPVVAGFMAGSGLLIVRGGLDVIAGEPIFAALAHFDAGLATRVAAAVIFIAAVLLLGRVVRTRLLLPGLVALALVAFNLAAAADGISAMALRAGHWLIALPPQAHFWPPLAPSDFAHIDWAAILPALAYLPSAVVLAITAVLMNATTIELDAKRDIDLDNELRAVGIANLLAGIVGGVPGFHSVTLTFLGNRLGGRSRIIGFTVAAMSLAALIFGHVLLDVIPTPLLGAMLMWTGGGLLAEWLVRSYARLSLREYLVVLLIFVAIAAVGFAWGLLVGIAAALALFVVEYGRVDIVRLLVTGRDYQSSVDASEERRQNLHTHGDAILIIRLQGFLFFGTAERLRQRVERRAAEASTSRTRFVVIDFRRVTGVDSSTVLSFIRLSQTAVREGFEIVLTGVSEGSRASMARGGLAMGEDADPFRRRFRRRAQVVRGPAADGGGAAVYRQHAAAPRRPPGRHSFRRRPGAEGRGVLRTRRDRRRGFPDRTGRAIGRHLLRRIRPRQRRHCLARPRTSAARHGRPGRHRRRGRFLPRRAALGLGYRRAGYGGLAAVTRQHGPPAGRTPRRRLALSPGCRGNAGAAAHPHQPSRPAARRLERGYARRSDHSA